MSFKAADLLGSPSQTDQQGRVRKPRLMGPAGSVGPERVQDVPESGQQMPWGWALGKQHWGLVGPG